MSRLLLSGILPTPKQHELLEVAQALDPIRLFQQLEQLQQAVFRCAVSCSPFVSNTPSVPIRLFSVERWRAVSFRSREWHPIRQQRSIPCTENRRGENECWAGDAQRQDPFDGEWEQITAWLLAHPERSSGDIFRVLQRRSPERYHPMQIRTFQRGMRKIRARILATFEEQWQEEVINGRLPATVLQAECAEGFPSLPNLTFNKPHGYNFP